MPYCPTCGKNTKLINRFAKNGCYCQKEAKPQFCRRCGGWLFKRPEFSSIKRCSCHDISITNSKTEALKRYSDIKDSCFVSYRLSIHLVTYLFTPSKTQRQSQYKALRRNFKLYYKKHEESAILYLPTGFHLFRYLKTTKIYPLIIKAKITIKHVSGQKAMNILTRLPADLLNPNQK